MLCLAPRIVDKKLRELCPLLFTALNETCPNYAVVGGAIRSILENRPVRDLDIICEHATALVLVLPELFKDIRISENQYHGYKIFIPEYNLVLDLWDTTNHIIPFDKIDDELPLRLGWSFNAIYYCPKTKYLYLESYNEAKHGKITYNDSETIKHHVLLSVSDLLAYLTWKSYHSDSMVAGTFLNEKVRQLIQETSFESLLEAYQKHYHKLPPDEFILAYYHEKYKN